MARAEIVRGHDGVLTVRVAGESVHGAVVAGVLPTAAGQMVVQINIPVQHVVFSEADNVLVFKRNAQTP